MRVPTIRKIVSAARVCSWVIRVVVTRARLITRRRGGGPRILYILVHVTPANWRQRVISSRGGDVGLGNHTDNVHPGGRQVASRGILFTIKRVVAAVRKGCACHGGGWIPSTREPSLGGLWRGENGTITQGWKGTIRHSHLGKQDADDTPCTK
jgi:hypothetical protein